MLAYQVLVEGFWGICRILPLLSSVYTVTAWESYLPAYVGPGSCSGHKFPVGICPGGGLLFIAWGMCSVVSASDSDSGLCGLLSSCPLRLPFRSSDLQIPAPAASPQLRGPLYSAPGCLLLHSGCWPQAESTGQACLSSPLGGHNPGLRGVQTGKLQLDTSCPIS